MKAQTFGAAVEHLHRAAGDLGGQRRVDLPGNVLFAAKAAAHERAANTHRFICQPQTFRHLSPVAIRDLTAHVNGEFVVIGIIACRDGQRTFWLHKSVFGHRRAIGTLDNHIGLRQSPRQYCRSAL